MKSDILKEYNDPESRAKAIQSRPQDALKLIFIFVKKGQMDFKEFSERLSEYMEDSDLNSRKSNPDWGEMGR